MSVAMCVAKWVTTQMSVGTSKAGVTMEIIVVLEEVVTNIAAVVEVVDAGISEEVTVMVMVVMVMVEEMEMATKTKVMAKIILSLSKTMQLLTQDLVIKTSVRRSVSKVMGKIKVKFILNSPNIEETITMVLWPR